METFVLNFAAQSTKALVCYEEFKDLPDSFSAIKSEKLPPRKNWINLGSLLAHFPQSVGQACQVWCTHSCNPSSEVGAEGLLRVSGQLRLQL